MTIWRHPFDLALIITVQKATLFDSKEDKVSSGSNPFISKKAINSAITVHSFWIAEIFYFFLLLKHVVDML